MLTEKQSIRVLNYCNNIRKSLGKKPVMSLKKGKQNSYENCPLAKTISNVSVGTLIKHPLYKHRYIKIKEEERDKVIVVPQYINDFIRKFDKGLYPELIQRGK